MGSMEKYTVNIKETDPVSVKQKRMTKQKALIWDILSNTKSHPTADWVYEKARKEMPNISLGTVYRNLQLLVTEGQVRELNYGKGFSRFDADMNPHCHFVCEVCGNIEDLPILLQEDLVAAAQAQLKGRIEDYRLEFYGVCAYCKQKQKTNPE